MDGFFTRERFGRPQVLAAIMLFAFLLQCLWLVDRGGRTAVDPEEIYRLERGTALWKHRGVLAPPPEISPELGRELEASPHSAESSGHDSNHSHFWYLIASAPLVLSPVELQPENIRELHWLAAAPYVVFGLLLGASLWYVSRRLFGNAGGYVALALYCFSPGILRASALYSAEPEVGAAWGAFGAIFTAIAVAHTLYAPREVVLWNWRRIVLLGLSLALAVGSQFSLVAVLPLALGFMLYLAPMRRLAAVAIWLVACVIGTLILYTSYFFHAAELWRGLKHATFSGLTWRAFLMPLAYRQVLAQLGQSCPALVVAVPIALVAYLGWPRARYFGNNAPLLIAALFLTMAVAMPHYPGLGFQLIAVPFLFVFVAGIAADLIETRQRPVALAAVWALLVANAAWNLWELARAGRG
ncbi:MAG TPA: hypothetical protein VHS34_07730 [Terriglobales bacterium]|jgi:hypothetical protein|nr:hypothetical protein [Terriglobales bacterium]